MHQRLQTVRIEGIQKMLIDKVSEENLAACIKRIAIEAIETAEAIGDVKKTLLRLSRSRLLEIADLALTQGLIGNEDIEATFEQYRYGLKPGFALFVFRRDKHPNISNFPNTDILEAMSAHLLRLSLKQGGKVDGQENEDAIMELKILSIEPIGSPEASPDAVEYSFSYLSKHHYLSAGEAPSFVYEYRDCFAWLCEADGYLAIQNAPDRVTNAIKGAFATAFSATVSHVRLTRSIVKAIFGDSGTKKATFINPNASEMQAEKMTLSDARFSQKEAISQAVSDYRMTGTYLAQGVGDGSPNTLGINCYKGKLYLSSNVSAASFRTWGLEKCRMIVAFLGDNSRYEDFEVFQARNLMDAPLWKGYDSTQKEAIELIVHALFVASCNGQEDAGIAHEPLNSLKLWHSLKPHLYSQFSAYCDTCEEPFVAHCDCGGSLGVDKNGDLFCRECGQHVTTVHCDQGHAVDIDAASSIVCYPDATLLRNIHESLGNVGLAFSGFFCIEEGRLSLVAEKSGGLVRPQSIPELKAILDIDVGSQEEKEGLLQLCQGVKEKCKRQTSATCNRCDSGSPDICMMKVFTTFEGYRPSPHQAGEFGDVSFTVTLEGKELSLVGIAKSAIKGKDSLNMGENAAREMLQQTLSATHDARIGMIAAICPMRFHEQFAEELRYIARLTGKAITILDDTYMIHQYKAYRGLQAALPV